MTTPPRLTRHPLTGDPIRPVGVLASGKVVWPVMGGAPDPVVPTPPAPVLDDADPAETADERVARIAAREKSQGKRAGQRELLEALGFTDQAAATKFIADQRAAVLAAETDADRRGRELDDRERASQVRETSASDREFSADVRVALIDRGCARADLDDAQVLLARGIDRALTGAELTAAVDEAADALKVRRPGLFSGDAVPPVTPPPPSTLTPRPPAPNAPPAADYGSAGKAEAERRWGAKK